MRCERACCVGKVIVLGLAGVVLIARVETASAQATGSSAADQSVGLGSVVELFNGKDLAGWKEFGSRDGWTVRDYALVSSPGSGWLGTEHEFSNFELTLEYRLEAGGNSGVFFRAFDEGHPSGADFLEVQLLDDASPQYKQFTDSQRNGSIYRLIPRTAKVSAPANRWNALFLKAVGPNLTVKVNGKVVLEASLSDYKATPASQRPSGRIGLQRHLSRAEFRKIKIRDLNSSSPTSDDGSPQHPEVTGTASTEAGESIVYPAPRGETLSNQCTVLVDGKPCPVYVAKVAPAAQDLRWKAMDDHEHTGDYFDMASFVYFDMRSPVTVTVTPSVPVRSAKVLPTAFQVKSTVQGNQISLRIPKPMNVTVEANGDSIHTLHIFANPLESDVPEPTDPDVIYFGPGVHEVTHIEVGDNKTLYLAGGAVLRARVGADERKFIGNTYEPSIVLSGKNSRVRGRGVIDASLCAGQSRLLLTVLNGSNALVEGVIFRDAPFWNLIIYKSQGVAIDNIKVLNRRSMSDGVDVVNSHDVTIERSFVRALDDNIAIKTFTSQELAKWGYAARPDEPPITDSRGVVIKDCVLWPEVANAVIIGPELRGDVDDVSVTNCDIVHNKGRCSEMRIENTDNARVQNVRFQNIRVEESRRLITLVIEKNMWSSPDNRERGHIKGVTFENIHATAGRGLVELRGADASHAVENVTFSRVFINGDPLNPRHGAVNAYVKGVQLRQ